MRIFEFAVIDLGLPDRPGEELIAELKMMRPDFPIIVASGYSEEVLRHRLEFGNRLAFLAKPYDLAGLQTAINALRAADLRIREQSSNSARSPRCRRDPDTGWRNFSARLRVEKARSQDKPDDFVVELGGSVLARLVVVSNRVSVPSAMGAKRAGGLEVALRPALQRNGGVWLGWSGKVAAADQLETRTVKHKNVEYTVTDLSKDDYQEYYNGFANRVLWPILHYRLDLAEFARRDLSGYFRVNDHFATELEKIIREDDLIWVHDYHLIPIADALRRRGHANRIGFFLHVPMRPRKSLPPCRTTSSSSRCFCNTTWWASRPTAIPEISFATSLPRIKIRVARCWCSRRRAARSLSG